MNKNLKIKFEIYYFIIIFVIIYKLIKYIYFINQLFY